MKKYHDGEGLRYLLPGPLFQIYGMNERQLTRAQAAMQITTVLYVHIYEVVGPTDMTSEGGSTIQHRFSLSLAKIASLKTDVS